LRFGVITLAQIVFDAAFQPQVWRDSSFSNHLRRLLVIAQTDKSAMPQVPGVRPLDEGDLADELWFDPSAFLHFLCG
jgi:hypothetical protein